MKRRIDKGLRLKRGSTNDLKEIALLLLFWAQRKI